MDTGKSDSEVTRMSIKTKRPTDVETAPVQRRRFPGIEGVWYLVAVLIVIGLVVNPSFVSISNLNNILLASAPIMLLALGQTFVLLGREIDLSVGSIVGFSAVICGNYMDHSPALVAPVAIAAILVGALFGLINGLVTTAFQIPSFVVTLGSMLVIRGLINVWTGGAPSSGVPPELTSWLVGIRFAGFSVGVLLVITFGVVLAYMLIHRTPYGRRLILTGASPAAARLAGLPARRTLVMAFVLSGAFAGGAGVYYVAWTGSARGDLGTGTELVAIAAAVLGGVSLLGSRGRVLSAAAGAIALNIILNLLIVAGLPLEAQEVGQGLIIIIAVLAYSRLRQVAPAWRARRSGRLRMRPDSPSMKIGKGSIS